MIYTQYITPTPTPTPTHPLPPTPAPAPTHPHPHLPTHPPTHENLHPIIAAVCDGKELIGPDPLSTLTTVTAAATAAAKTHITYREPHWPLKLPCEISRRTNAEPAHRRQFFMRNIPDNLLEIMQGGETKDLVMKE